LALFFFSISFFPGSFFPALLLGDANVFADFLAALLFGVRFFVVVVALVAALRAAFFIDFFFFVAIRAV
jgi:hypothetical protein